MAPKKKRRPRPKEYKTRHIPRKNKTTTKQGMAEYMRQYMRMRRAEEKLAVMRLDETLGIDLKKLQRVQRPPR